MTEIRSYRRVFDLERRIYRVDRLKLNPGGVPVRGVLYFLAILVLALATARLPVIATVAGSVPWYLRSLALPALLAAGLTLIRIEGRPFHLAAHAMLRYLVGPRMLAGMRIRRRPVDLLPGERWFPERLLMLPDGSDSCMRRFRYSGPGVLRIAVEHRRELKRGLLGRRPRMIVCGTRAACALARREVIVLERSVRLVVR